MDREREEERIDDEVENFKAAFGRRVHREMDKNTLSQNDLAEIANLSPSTISAIIKGKRMMTCETLRDIAAALRVSTDYLLGIRPKNYDDLMRDPRVAHVIRQVSRMDTEKQEDVFWYIDCVSERKSKKN